MLGIIGAMELEVANLKDMMKDVSVEKKASMEFYKGKLNGADVVIVRSGIGKVNAAVCTQILVDDFNVDSIINTGVAGSLRAEINIADIVLSTDALEHDMDVTPLGYKKGEIPSMDTSVFVADEKLKNIARECCSEVIPEVGVFEGRVVSGDQFISSAQVKDALIENFAGSCAEMEGASIAHAAHLNGVPFLVIRAISDKADNSAHMDYPEFERKATENSVKLINAIAGKFA